VTQRQCLASIVDGLHRAMTRVMLRALSGLTRGLATSRPEMLPMMGAVAPLSDMRCVSRVGASQNAVMTEIVGAFKLYRTRRWYSWPRRR